MLPADSILRNTQSAVSQWERRVAELRKAERSELLDKLTGYTLPFSGHEGYAKVTAHIHPYG